MNKFLVSIIVAPALSIAFSMQAQSEAKPINVSQLTDNIYMLSSESGGNLGVSIGEDGTFMIDDKYAPDAPVILEALKSIGGQAPSYLANTHHHGDHTGGNQFFGEQGALIIAHTNLRKWMKSGYEVKAFNMVVEPASKEALPSITYDEDIRLHLNGDDVHLIHVANAHTDNDSIVHFSNANVIHTGDTFFNGFFPFIDVGRGGSLPGVIKALGLVAELADENTQIIPGHGPMATKRDVETTIEMLSLAHKRLNRLQSDGATLEEAIAAKPIADIEEKWGGVMFTADQWIGTVWKGL